MKEAEAEAQRMRDGVLILRDQEKQLQDLLRDRRDLPRRARELIGLAAPQPCPEGALLSTSRSLYLHR